MIRALIIGAGNIAAQYDNPGDSKILSHGHALFDDERFELAGFVDIDLQRAERACACWGGQAFASLQDAANALGYIDIFVVAVPDNLHVEICRQIIPLDPKIIVLEKPVAQTYAEAQALKKDLEAKGVTTIVNYSRRYSPYFQKLKQRIAGGEFGKFIRGAGYYGKGIKHNGSHMIDLLRFLVGEFSDNASVIDSFYDYGESDPSVSVILTHIQGGTLSLQAVDSRVLTIFDMDLLFENGRLRVFDLGFSAEESRIVPHGVYHLPVYESALIADTELHGVLQNLYNDVVSFLKDESAKPVCSFNDGITTLRLCEALANIRHVGK